MIRELALLPVVRRIHYENALDTPDQGLYWRVDCVDDDGNTWDIDNWLVANDHPNAGLADGFAAAMENRLDDTSRRDILSIKSSFATDARPRGIDVYKAVLRDGVRTPEDFRRWQGENPPVTIEEWRP